MQLVATTVIVALTVVFTAQRVVMAVTAIPLATKNTPSR
jgi:hypothetical protein